MFKDCLCCFYFYFLQIDLNNVPSLKECWKYLQRGEGYGVHCTNSQVVISLLLILAGDIEVNPGPGKNISYLATVSRRIITLLLLLLFFCRNINNERPF